MATELQVYVALVDTEPEQPGNPGVIIRSQRQSTLVADAETNLADCLTLAESRLKDIIEEVEIDAVSQIQIAKQSAGPV